MYEVECVVIGAGVIGLAIARELAMAGREVIVLEAEAKKGLHASSRNTGVIHAGVNYAQDSLKNRFCIDGKARLYRYCEEKGIPHAKIGKIIPCDRNSGESGLALLRSMQEKSRRQGMPDLHFMTADEVRKIEPNLVCGGALWSPTSGIIDVHAYMDALQGDLEDHRGFISFGAPVMRGKLDDARILVEAGDRDATRLACRILINASGLNAPHVAASFENRPQDTIPPRLLSRGIYAVLQRPSPFSHLVYPAPHGLHVSPDLGGQLRFGPDSEWIDDIDYTFDERRIAPFYEKIRAFWPDIKEGDLAPGWAAIRAKISTGGAKDVDFRIDLTETGACQLVDLFGIESPGLTSSLAIAAHVRLLVDRPVAQP